MDQYSPKSGSPLGSRSPSIAQNVDPSGLKLTISLKQKSPFYLIRPEITPSNETTGATNLMAARGLEHSYIKLTSKFGGRASVNPVKMYNFFFFSKEDERFPVFIPS